MDYNTSDNKILNVPFENKSELSKKLFFDKAFVVFFQFRKNTQRISDR